MLLLLSKTEFDSLHFVPPPQVRGDLAFLRVEVAPIVMMSATMATQYNIVDQIAIIGI